MGCGSDSGDDAAGGGGGELQRAAARSPPPRSRSRSGPRARTAPPQEATLTCDPAGGTHPNPEKACELLAADPAALEPVPPDTACTMIYGGPEEATIVGVVNGEEVDAAFNRSGGCELDRWDRMAAVLQLGD